MPFTLGQSAKIFIADQVVESVSEAANTNLFLTFGKPDAWANDSAPPTPNTADTTVYEVWRNMIGGKRITAFDISHAAPRHNWANGVNYVAYDDQNSHLWDSDVTLYVLTSEFNVYKCLGNNNSRVSLVMPTAINPNTISQTADGYVWKYMFTMTDQEKLRFLTPSWMPVKTLTIDDNSLQWDVQDAATEGAIYRLNLESVGALYTNNSNVIVTIAGDGTGATATANVNTQSNVIHTLTMTAFGQDYTYASAVITGGGGSGATARPIISPPGGHGSDPIYELGAKNLVFNPRIRGKETDTLIANNDFRQVAILKDPYRFGTANAFTNSTFSQATVLTLSGGGSDYIEDEIVYQGATLIAATFSGRVVYWDSANSAVHLTDIKGTPTNDGLTGANSTANKFVSSVRDPELKPYSGRFIYLDNITPIVRNPDQTDDFKIIFTF